MIFKVKNNVHWVGKTDWELRKFHGDEYSTHRGSTYNSYLIQEEKTVLIDTVWAPFAEEFVENLARHIDLNRIDCVIANHAEIDHSGALPELMRRIPGKSIYCTANGVKSLKGHYHQDWDFRVVKTGDALELGSKKLVFVEAPMLHWPDSMFCYLTGDNILFSNDAFGQHYASESMFNTAKSDKNDIIAEIFKSKAILVGSPTINRGILTGIAALLEEIKGLKFKGKKAAAFGCYGWSGEGNKLLAEHLRSAGFEVVGDGFKALWNPDDQAAAKAVEFGRQFAHRQD
jgi:flavorubredoxin